MSNRSLKVELPYGNTVTSLNIPAANLAAIVRPREMHATTDPETLVRDALRMPIGAPSCAQLLRNGERLLIVIDDMTRPTPISLILPILLQELQVKRKRVHVTILVALGTHRKMTAEEIRVRVGDEVMSECRVVNHEWDNEETLLDLGMTPSGIPVKVNRLVMDADTCIGVGNIVPHNIAGWSGGGKIIIPGVSSKETTNSTHLLAARAPSTHLGRLANPVRIDIEEGASRTTLRYVVNTILDHHGRLAHVVAGDPRSAHREGVALARTIWEIPVPRLADIVVVSSYPADLDFWQANKGLYVAERLVKRGGDIVLLTPCPEGLSGQPEHVRTIEALAGVASRELYHEAVRRGIRDFAALTVCDIAARCRDTAYVTVVSSGLTSEMARLFGFDHEPNIDAAVRKAFQRQGQDAKITIVTHGGEISPVLSEP